MPREDRALQPLCADIDGFSLHAAVRVEAYDRKRLEQLCRYITRPALSDERVQPNAAGQVELKLKTPWHLAHLACEPAGWYYLAHGTASQYLNRRDEANAMFGEALKLSQAQGWERLEHFVHVHWGRSRAEERLFSDARAHFQRALSQRERLQHPGAGRVRELLSALDAIEGGHVQDLLPSDPTRPFG